MAIGGEPAPKQNTLSGAVTPPTGPAPRLAVAPLLTARAHSREAISVTNWKLTNVGLRLGADAASAASASVLIAPIVTVIDRYVDGLRDIPNPDTSHNLIQAHSSIVHKASTGVPFRAALSHSLRPIFKAAPHRFLTSRPFLLVFALYTSTYFTANAIDTATSTLQAQPAPTVTTGHTKFIATSAVNMTLCIYKDSCFARMFGGGDAASPAAAAATAIPRISYLPFALRDSLTIFASFNLPPLIAPHLSSLPSTFTTQLPHLLRLPFNTEASRSNTAQFLAPALMQLVSTPIHLLGLDLYNRQGVMLGFRERLARVRRDWSVSTLARMGRIVPAFGIGGVVNGELRRSLMGKIS